MTVTIWHTLKNLILAMNRGPEVPTLKPKSFVTWKRSLTLYEPLFLYLQDENLILIIGFFSLESRRLIG